MADNETEVEERQDAEPLHAGERLRLARERKDVSLKQLSAETRIPIRHLESIEKGDFAALPGLTYATGFSRTFAQMVDLDGEDVARQVREELEDLRAAQEPRHTAHYEPGDPARVPSSGLTWLTVLAVVLLLSGGYAAYWAFLSGPTGMDLLGASDDAAEAPAAMAEAPEDAEAAPAAVDPTGDVVFTALEEGVWVKFYDANGRQLMQKQMALGESYTVPDNVDGPQLWTGRPDAFSITIGGRAVPKLAESDSVMRDVPVTAEALLARQDEPSTPEG